MHSRQFTFLWILLMIPLGVSGGDLPSADDSDPEILVKEIYDLVSASPGESVDWEKLRSLFSDQAIVVLRTSREATTRFTREGFIEDFKRFYTTPAVVENGFRETVLELRSQVYKDMAYVAVVYEASIPNTERPPQKGIDLWLVSRMEGKWEVLAVTNEIVLHGEDLPDFLAD